VPDIMPALPLFAQLRRYTLAVIEAAEVAAMIALLMKTTTLGTEGEAAEVPPLTELEFRRNMAVFVPEGWEPHQLKAEQPTTTYGEFKGEILNEIARCLNMPYNIAAGNSSSYNYASGRLDHQTYYKSIRVDQAQCEGVILDRILLAWLAEAVQVMGLPAFFEAMGGLDAPHQWFWDGHEHVDPVKEANAQATRIASNTTTLAQEFALKGQDWEVEVRQRGKEVALLTELGLLPQASQPQPDQPEPDEDDDAAEEREAAEDRGDEPVEEEEPAHAQA